MHNTKEPLDALEIPAPFRGRDQALAERARTGTWSAAAAAAKPAAPAPKEPRGLRRTAAARDRRGDAVKGAVANGADTFEKMRMALAGQEMNDGAIRSGINRALELRWIKRAGRRYTRDV